MKMRTALSRGGIFMLRRAPGISISIITPLEFTSICYLSTLYRREGGEGGGRDEA